MTLPGEAALHTLCRYGAALPWALGPPVEPDPRNTEDHLGEVLEAAVARAIASAPGRVAVALSGGVDSTVVAALARRILGRDLRLYVLESGRAPAQAAFVAARLGLPVRPVPAPRPAMVSVTDVAFALGQPTHSAAPFGFLPLWRALARDGVRTVLTGDGADELFGGHAYHRSPPAEWPDVWGTWRSVRALGMDADALLLRSGGRPTDRGESPASWSSDPWEASPAARRVEAEVLALPPAARLRHLDVRLRMGPQCLDLQRRLTGAAGLDYRAPFGELDVMAVALGLPVPTPATEKAPLRRLARALLGVELPFEKEPLQAPTGGALRGPWRGLLAPHRVKSMRLFVPDAVARLSRRHDPRAPFLDRALVVVATAHALQIAKATAAERP